MLGLMALYSLQLELTLKLGENLNQHTHHWLENFYLADFVLDTTYHFGLQFYVALMASALYCYCLCGWQVELLSMN